MNKESERKYLNGNGKSTKWRLSNGLSNVFPQQYHQEGEYYKIEIQENIFVLIDKDDLPKIEKKRIFFAYENVMVWSGRKNIQLSNYLMDTETTVIHNNNNRLDCRKGNLTVYKVKYRRDPKKVAGVSSINQKWRARISHKKILYESFCAQEEDAIEKRKEADRILRTYPENDIPFKLAEIFPYKSQL